jgi:hypothetical protein
MMLFASVVWACIVLSSIAIVAPVVADVGSLSISKSRTMSVSASKHRSSTFVPRPPATPAPLPAYSGPTQIQSSSNIVTAKQTLITVRTEQALVLAKEMLELENDQLSLASRKNFSVMSVDDILSVYYTWGAAYEYCRFLSFHLNMMLSISTHNQTDIAKQFKASVEAMWDDPGGIIRTSRNGTCSLAGGSVGVSMAVLTEVPQVNRTYYPPTFSIFIMGQGLWGASVTSFLSPTFSTNYVASYRPFDLIETLGFLGLVYKSPAAPAATTVTVYAVTKESAFSRDGGVAIWTFLMVQVISLCTAVVVGMTVVRWIIKPPALPPLKERIMKGGGFVEDDSGESGSFVGVVGSFNANGSNDGGTTRANETALDSRKVKVA